MCGIVYKHNFDGTPVNNDILQQYDKQSSRGKQGFGLFDGEYKHIVKESKEDSILKWLVKYDSNLIMFHHRFPTSTENVKRAAHPFSTKDYFGDTQYILVHNGIISNADEMYDEHVKLGIEYNSLLSDGSFNDSEALLWDTALTLQGRQDKPKVYGGVAFLCVELHKGELENLWYYRNWGRPLRLYRGVDSIEISSEGKGVEVPENKLYRFDYTDQVINFGEYPQFLIPSYKPYTAYQYSGQQSLLPYRYDDEEYEQDFYTGRGTPGDWASDELRNKFLKNTVQAYSNHNVDEIIDLNDYDNDIDAIFAPSDDAVDKLVIEYLSESKGVFEVAYWRMENDYDALLDYESTYAEFCETYKLEKAMERISGDPEYINKSSVSSMWRGLCS